MKESLVMTLIGKDRYGLVESLAAIIEEHDGNWEESRLVQLAGEFAGLVHVHVPSERTAELENALAGLEGMSVVVARATDEPPSSTPSSTFTLEVVGQDHPGIVHRLSEAIAAQKINIEELETGVSSAPMSGEKLFRAKANLVASGDVRLEDLEARLEQLAADLMVDIRLAEPDRDPAGSLT